MGSEDGYGAPPAYQEGSGPSSELATAHDCSLRVRTGPYFPGSTVPVTISVSHKVAASLHGPIQVSLQGLYSADLMGKARYQTGSAANTGFSGGGNPYVVTKLEQHVFASVQEELHVEDEKASSHGQDPLSLTVQLAVPSHRTCSCSADRPRDILPSARQVSDQDKGFVRWRVRAEFKRKGLLKRDFHLTQPIEVILPAKPPRADPLVCESCASLKFTGGGSANGEHPILNLKMEVLPNDSEKTGVIPFRLTFAPSSGPPLLLPGHLWPQGDACVTLVLSRHVWTKGVESHGFDPSDGCRWPGYTVSSLSKGKGPGFLVQDEAPGGGWCLRGEYEYDRGQKTIHGCGLSIDWQLNAHVQWKQLAKPLQAQVKIELPYT